MREQGNATGLGTVMQLQGPGKGRDFSVFLFSLGKNPWWREKVGGGGRISAGLWDYWASTKSAVLVGFGCCLVKLRLEMLEDMMGR
jgi:hypothetical protein